MMGIAYLLKFHLSKKKSTMPSNKFNRSIHAISDTSIALELLEFNNKLLSMPILIVNDNVNIVSNGKLFSRGAFYYVSPEIGGDRNPRTSIKINYNIDIERLIKQYNGLENSSITIYQVMRSSPNAIEHKITFDVGNISIDKNKTISFELKFNNLFTMPVMHFSYRPELAEGLYE